MYIYDVLVRFFMPPLPWSLARALPVTAVLVQQLKCVQQTRPGPIDN